MKQAIEIGIVVLMLSTAGLNAQANEAVSLMRDFETKAAAGNPRAPEEAAPLLERFGQDSRQDVLEALPVISQDSTSPYTSVRRLASAILFAISLRPDGQALLSEQTPTFSAFFVDPDLPIRRLTVLTLANIELNADSPLISELKAFLSREDAVSTIGAGVAGLLMKDAPDDTATIAALVRYMHRKDQNSASRNELLQSVRVAKSNNREIGKAVASYANDLNKETSIQAVQTLQGMGVAIIADNQQLLSKIAADNSRDPRVRTAASKALGENLSSPRQP